MSRKRRTTTVGVFSAHVTTGWARSTVVLDDNRTGKAPVRVIIEIDRPSDLEYIREQLNLIEAAWRKELDSLMVRHEC